MPAWGSNLKSCDNLLNRLERNDPTLKDVIILSTKTFTEKEMNRIISVLDNGINTSFRSLSASGHKLPSEVYYHLGKVLAKQITNHSNNEARGFLELAIGDQTMGDDGIVSFCNGIIEGDKRQLITLQSLDLSMKGMGIKGLQTILKTLSQIDKNQQLHVLNLSRNPQITTTTATAVNASDDHNNNNTENNGDHSSTNENANTTSMPRVILPYIHELDISKCEFNGNFLTQHLFLNRATTPTTTTNSMVYSFQNLKILRLDHNPISSTGFEAVVAILLGREKNGDNHADKSNKDDGRPCSSTSALEEIYVSHCSIHDEAMKCLLLPDDESSSFVRCCRLRKLDISYNQLTPKGIDYLGQALQGSSSKKGNSKEGNANDAPISSVGHFPELVDLNLAGNNVGREGIITLSNALIHRNSTINAIATKDENSDKTRDIKPIQALDISETNCEVSGAIALIGIGHLRSLRLFNNNLGKSNNVRLLKSSADNTGSPTANNDGGTTIVTAAAAVTADNVADADTVGGLEFIAKSLQGLSSSMLETLDVSGNNAGEADVSNFLRSLLSTVAPHDNISNDNQPLPKLQLLVVGGNGGGDQLEQAVAEIKQIRPKLDIARDKKRRY